MNGSEPSVVAKHLEWLVTSGQLRRGRNVFQQLNQRERTDFLLSHSSSNLPSHYVRTRTLRGSPVVHHRHQGLRKDQSIHLMHDLASPSGLSTLFSTTMGRNPNASALDVTNFVCGIGPSAASTSNTTPSTIDKIRLNFTSQNLRDLEYRLC